MNDLGLTDTPFLVGLLIATATGLIIGLEREFKAISEKDSFAGIRTYPLIAIVGYITTILASKVGMSLLYVIFPSFVVLLLATYITRSQKGHTGITSELAMVITFFTGAFVAYNYIREALAITVITTTLLSLKGKFKSFVGQLTQQEIYAFVRFSVLALLILPFLPDENFGPEGLLNPRDIGFVVVVVSSLSFVGYLLIKFIDHRCGILLTAAFGGLFSSTGVAWVFSARSQTDQQHSVSYAAGIILASCIMFLRIGIVTTIFNFQVFKVIVAPCIAMAIVGLVAAGFIVRKQKIVPKDEMIINLGNPVNLVNALGFGLLYVAIVMLVYVGNLMLGSKGLLLSGIISGLADVDAITIAMSDYANNDGMLRMAVIVILSAVMSNTIVKTMIAVVRGSKETRQYVLRAMGAVVAVGLISIFLLLMLESPDE